MAQFFDNMHWWENGRCQLYPHIYVAVALVSAMPDSNADQERTFSAATWMDGKLSKKQSDLTFQMKVLLYKNKDFLKNHLKILKEDEKKKGAARTKALLDISCSLRDDEDLEDELEDLLMTYDALKI